MAWLRDIDRWLVGAVLPGAARYRALAARLVGPADADDLVQEAYARLLATPHWREIANPPAFALRVVRNLALDRLRRASVVRIDQAAALESLDVEDEAPGPDAVVATRTELARVLELVDRLPPQCRAVVRMRKLDGLSPREIADSLGLSVSTVEKHLAKGIAAITEGLARSLATREGEDRPRPWTRRRRRA